MEETWKDIKGYEGLYQISNLGRVKSLSRIINKGKYGKILSEEKIMKLKNNRYFQIMLHKDGKYKIFYVHRLVAQAFILNPNNYEQVNHKNGNKLDNRLENLEWCTREYNMQEAYRLGLKKAPIPMKNKFGKSNKRSKKVFQFDKNGKLISIFYGCCEAERITGVIKTSISKCCLRKIKTAGGYIWKYVVK